MRRVVQDVFLLESLAGGCVYAIALDDGFILIDSGMPGDVNRIAGQLEWAGFRMADLRAIVLTHAHFDHTGSAAELGALSGAEVLAHRGDAPYVEAPATLPYPTELQRFGLGLANAMLGDTAACRVTRVLDDGDVLAEFGGLRVIHTPGHTPGSICLYRPAGRLLFSGDLLVNSPRFYTSRMLHFSYSQFSLDPDQARRSARKLLDVPIDVLCCGHGEPITNGAAERIREVLRDGSFRDPADS